jgi:hypothetical protein
MNKYKMVETEKRAFRVQIETGFKINNISLVKCYIVPKKIEVMKKKNLKMKESYECKLSINNTIIEPSHEDEKFYYFDFKEIRNYLREIIPMDEHETNLSNLETMLTYNSLCAQNAYKELMKESNFKEIFNTTIFTNQDLEVKLITKCKNQFIDLEEEYYRSDVHQNS